MESKLTGDSREWRWAYLLEDESYIFQEGKKYLVIKRIGNLVILQGEYDDTERKGEFGCDVPANIGFGSETQGTGC